MDFGKIRGSGILSIGGELFAVRATNLVMYGDAAPTVELAILQEYDFSEQHNAFKERVMYENGIKPCKHCEIKDVIFNDPATIVIWSDGTKTVVKCQPGDKYSRETGLAMCIVKKYLGNKSNFNEVFKKWIFDYDK